MSTNTRPNARRARSAGRLQAETIANPEQQTDIAAARRFVELHGDRVRFCHPWRKWLVWDSRRWKLDDDGGVMRLAKSLADPVWQEARQTGDSAALRFAARTASDRGIKALLALAASDVPIQPADMDGNGWLLNCPNGTLNLRTGTLRDHRREDCLTKLCPTKFDPGASAPTWEAFLRRIFDEDRELVSFVQRLCGYALTGDVSEQILAILWGTGSNGKTTLLNALMGTLGLEYSLQAVSDLLIVKRNDAHPTERADLFGKRFVAAAETEQSRYLAESLVKQLTGGDKIRARRMREDFWEFSPTHKLFMCTNHKPHVKGNDHAIWRRLVLVPFTVKFWNPDKGESGPVELRQDKSLPEKLRAEAAGILAWAVHGCRDWQREGLCIPDAVRAATAKYRSEEDNLGRFVADCCLTTGAVRVKFSQLFEALEKWCTDNGEELPSRKAVGQWLQEHDFEEQHSGGRWYRGIALRADSEPA